MKKFLLFLMFALFCIPWAANAQETLTVHDGTNTSSYIPHWGLWADNSLQSEMVYPATELSDMTGGSITNLHYYSNGTSNITSWNGTCQIFMMEIESTSLSEFAGPTDATVVYDGPIALVDGEMTIELSTPYNYGGGNLLVGFYYTTGGSYASVNWLGEDVSGASIYGRSGQSYSVTAGNFLPKTTFTYTPGETDCDMPTSINVNNISANGATVTWEGDGSAWNLRYKASTDADFTMVNGLTSQTYTFTGLNSNTTYSVGVQTVCTGSPSFFKSTSFTTDNPCLAPTNLVTSDITDASATLSWTAGYPTQSSWIVNYKKSADAWTDAQTETVTSPTVTLANLEENTTYNVRIYACADGAYLSGNFTTKYACAAPTNFVASNITGSSATISWTAGYQETEWTVKYKKSSESSWDNATSVSVNGTPTTSLTGLDVLTIYNVRVYNCTGESDPYLSGNFTTAASFPYSQDFSGSGIPTGWAQYSGLLADVMAGTALTTASYGWSNGTSNSVLDGNHLYSNIYGASCMKWIVTPAIPVESGARLTFDVAYTAYSGTAANPQTTGTDDKFVVLASTDNMATWTILRQWDNAGSEYVLNELTPTALHQIFDLADYAGQNVIVAFYGESTESNADNDIHVDNVVFELTPSCEKPTGLSVENNGLDATFTWSSDATSFDVAYSMDNTANPDNVIVATVNTTSYEFTNLALGDHYVWVRTNCSATEQSEWAGPNNIHIGHCVPAPTSVDNQGISNVTFGVGDNIVNNTTTMGTSVATCLDYTSMTGALQAGVESTVAITYKTSYTYGTIIWVDFDNSLSFEESEIVYMGTSTSANPTTLNATFVIPATVTPGNYVMRIGGADSYFDGYIGGTSTTAPDPCYTGTYACFQDYTLSVLEAPSCMPISGLTSSNVTAHTVDLTWTAGGDETAWVVAYKAADEEEFTEVPATTNSFTLSGLSSETTYTVKVAANCGVSQSLYSQEITFTTTVACPAPTALNVTNLAPTSATLNWTGDATTYNVRYKVSNTGDADPIFSDDFENGLDLTSWTIVDADGDGHNWYEHINTGSSNLTTHSGDGVVASESYYNDEGQALTPDNWLITPQVQLGGSVSFWAMGQDADYAEEHFAVFVSTTGTTPADFTQVSQEFVATGEYVNYIADLSSYSGMGYVAIRHFNVTDMFILNIDDFAVYGPSAAGEEEWITINNVSGNSTDLTGLNPETDYIWQVQAVCGGEDGESAWTSSSFTTLSACAVPSELTAEATDTEAALNWTGYQDSYNVQYRTAGFDGYYINETWDGEIGDWSASNLHSSSGIFSGQGVDGGKCFGFYYTTDPPQYLISPYLREGVGGKTLTFSYKAYSASYAESFMVGFAIGEEMTWEEEVTTENTDWHEYQVVVPEGAEYFVISCTSYDAFCLFVDNIVIYAEDAIVEAGPWMNTTATGTTANLTDLTPETEYEWQVQGVDCAGAGTTTEWSEAATFTTDVHCGIVFDENNEWKENFENMTTSTKLFTGVTPQCWTVAHEYTSPSINHIGLEADTLPQLYRSFNTTENGHYSLRMKYRSLLAMPELDESIDLSRVRMSLNVRQPQTYYKLQIGVMSDLEDESTFVPVATVNNGSTSMSQFVCDFSGYTGEGRYIAFKNVGGSTSDPYCSNYLDDIVLTYLDEASCAIDAIPYKEDFEGFTTSGGASGVEPDCWEVISEDVALDATTKPQVYAGFNTTEGGHYSLRMKNRCVYAMPEFAEDVDVKELTLSFSLRQAKSFYRLEVGVVDAAGNFVAVEEINNPGTSIERDVTVDFSTLEGEGTGKRIAFHNILRNSAKYDYSYNYIDDINLYYTSEGPEGSKTMEFAGSDEMNADHYLDNIAVYPNPTTGMLHIDAVDVQKVECYSQMGQLVGVYDNVNELNISELANGVYMLRITVPQGVTMRKVVKR